MTRPRLLDLFCGAGGCARGYVEAGFDVIGVDNKPQKNYLRSGATAFVQMDAIAFCDMQGHLFDAIHASPPCQRYSRATRITGNKESHPDLVAPTRAALLAVAKPYVIENVPGAPLLEPALVCGLALGCGVKRHRLFEASFLLFSTTCPVGHRGDYLGVFGNVPKPKKAGCPSMAAVLRNEQTSGDGLTQAWLVWPWASTG